jgi:hypothetical protein
MKDSTTDNQHLGIHVRYYYGYMLELDYGI